MNTKHIVADLRREHTHLKNQLSRTAEAIDALARLGVSHSSNKKKRTMSASARRRIGAAQRARWAKLKAAKK
jgi:ABC-type phosphate/phosphonate transport system ATPase subunit